ncbi:hypothetical protein GUJ93_ZPchr0005g15294 [Zizania palustris]|uniref:Uncharacterized protein n=1 Tax=Zizania palustris TaxID=103762 RepID=A0A8J5VQE4_ZIZPA|nr:hypothetical protein GUJ93_ZPchr0005g15294 [Zizania palustris]KAG8067156.1 hypothetical protein GUJ93_ZPchr0005g15294 [Zizania palustris]
MIHTAIATLYLTAEQLRSSQSHRDGVDEPTESSLRAYGCELVQEAGILLRLYPLHQGQAPNPPRRSRVPPGFLATRVGVKDGIFVASP